MPPLEPSRINLPPSSSSSATPQKKSAKGKGSKPRPSRWTDKPLADRIGPKGVPLGADGSEDWNAQVFEVQYPELHRIAQANTTKPVSGNSIRARLGKLVKEFGAFEASRKIAYAIRADVGGDPLDYIEGMKRGARDEEERGRRGMTDEIEYR